MKARTTDGRLQSSGKAGFTLVELLVTVVIIAMLASIVLGISGYAQRKAANDRAKAEIKALELALEDYKLNSGSYPASTAGRANATTNSNYLYTALAGGSPPYFEFSAHQLLISGSFTNIVDPFGSPYNYYRTYPATTEQVNMVSFDLWSYGADGVSGIADDITNWQ